MSTVKSGETSKFTVRNETSLPLRKTCRSQKLAGTPRDPGVLRKILSWLWQGEENSVMVKEANVLQSCSMFFIITAYFLGKDFARALSQLGKGEWLFPL